MSENEQVYEPVALSFIDSCDQLPLLLIHGFPFNNTMWEEQVVDLAEITRVIAPDLRGHGRSDAPDPPYTMSDLAQDCVGLLDYLGIDRPVVVGGLSMGGYITFEIYRQFPERVAGLILASTRASADDEAGKANRDQMAAQVQEEGVTAVTEGMLPKLLAPESYEADEDLVAFVAEMMAGTSAEGMVGALMAMKERPDSTPLLGEIAVPTLVIHGSEDQIVPLDEAEAMADTIATAELVVIPDAGHLPNLEQPDLFTDVLYEFMDELQEDYYHG